jgi:hypothetical protein
MGWGWGRRQIIRRTARKPVLDKEFNTLLSCPVPRQKQLKQRLHKNVGFFEFIRCRRESMNLYPVDTQEKSHVNNRFPEEKRLQYFFSFSKQINLVSPNIINTFALFQMCVAGK